jgi:hypothetical protein
MAISRNLEKSDIYINKFWTGEYSQRSPLFAPVSAMGIQMVSRMDTLWDGLNVEISHNSTLQRRYGFNRYCSAAFGTSEYPLAFYSFKNTDGTIKAIVDTPTRVAWFDSTSLHTVFTKTSTAQTSFQKVGDTLYFCDGVSAQKWDGTTTSGWGIASPTTAPTLTFSTTSGVLSPQTGYQYVFLYKNSSTGHVSTASPVSASTGTLVLNNITLQGSSSSDPQVDKVDIYRTYDGGSVYYYLATVNNGGTWNYTDSTPDNGLNDFIVAPLSHSNDAPPAGISLVKFHMGRMWVAVGNLLYFAGGPDVTNGVPEEAFPPANVFKFPGKVTAMASTSTGLVVFTQDDAYIVLGTTTATFSPQLWQANFGTPNQNCVAQDGDLLFVYTSQGQLFQISSDLQEIGFPIQSKIGAYNSTNVRLALHRSGADEGLFISDGISDIRRYSVAMSCWSPVAQPVGGVGCIASMEVAASTYRLIMGRTSGGGHILSRDTTTYADDGSPYSAWAIVGSLMLAPPRQTALINSVLLETTAVGTYPTVQVLLNEISGTFVTLPNPVPDPPRLQPSTSVRMLRHDLKAAQTPLPGQVRHMQLKIVWPSEATKGELLGLGIS